MPLSAANMRARGETNFLPSLLATAGVVVPNKLKKKKKNKTKHLAAILDFTQIPPGFSLVFEIILPELLATR